MTEWRDHREAASKGPNIFQLANTRGDRVTLLDLGARIRSITLSLHDGPREVVLGYPELSAYHDDRNYLGCTIGRFCNRIARSRFTIDGKTYRLSENEGIHHLHGGLSGFDRRTWRATAAQNGRSIAFTLESADDDQGYPGTLSVRVTYRWNDDRELLVEFGAETDRPTHVNLTSHSYFNLDANESDVLGHSVRIDGDKVIHVDADKIPTGGFMPLEDTDLDMRIARTVAEAVASRHELVRQEEGVDLSYVLSGAEPAAELWSSARDLCMTLHTSCPGLQFYTGHKLTSPFAPYAGLCLEPQYFPDSPNQPGFPSTLLSPGRSYRELIRYRFTEFPRQ